MMGGKGMFGRVLIAVGLAASMVVSVGAQTYNAIGSGGPLWWFPENDGSYSRHHDLWHLSYVEALGDDWGTVTSFPTIRGDDVWVSDVAGAPPNSACDLQNGVERINVGPPYPDRGVSVVRTARTPSGSGGFAGLQISMHIGEWWQGMKYRGYYDDATARAVHFKPGYDPAVFGWFDVGPRWPLNGAATLDWPATGECLPITMVKMHGEEGGGQEQVFPPTPVGADGGECWSSARAMVLRANSEARCEPDLAQRYPYTLRFWTMFDAAPPRPIPSPPWGSGGSYTPLFPPDYAAPYLMARRGEIALYTVSELAAAAPPAVPWAPVRYPNNGAAGMIAPTASRARAEARFLDPNRVDPFGGDSYGEGTVEVYNSDLGVTECLELGEPGWTAARGTLVIDCAHGRENSERTARVNRPRMGHGTADRTREVGPVDNSTLYGGRALARRHAGLWAPPAGFGWFEHRNATLGCLFLDADVNNGLIADAEAFRQAWLREMFAAFSRWRAALADYQACPDTTPPEEGDNCRAEASARMGAARAEAIRAFRYSYGWEIIRNYRRVVLPELESALAAASPYGYAGSRGVLTATSRVLGYGGNACVTNLGGGTYNEAVIPTYPYAANSIGSGEFMVPGQGGPMWYGQAFDGYGAHRAGETGDHYTQFADVAGRTTNYSEAVINPGSEYPAELRAYNNYNNVRMGTAVWREFACKTVHEGYYGMGLTHVGTSTLDHREDPANAWITPDPRITLGDMTATQYSSGTPCVGDDAYDARGADGTRRCFDPDAGLGAYSTSAHPSGEAGFFKLEYSGDASSDTGVSGSVGITRPAPYRMLDGSEYLALHLRSGYYHMRYGYRSLDVERQRIWAGYGGWWGMPSSWLITAETYQGTPPGWQFDAGRSETARLEHHGQVSWYGAMVPGGTGGCTFSVDGGTPLDGKPPQGPVMEGGGGQPTHRIICLLPLDVGPDGKCPGENLP